MDEKKLTKPQLNWFDTESYSTAEIGGGLITLLVRRTKTFRGRTESVFYATAIAGSGNSYSARPIPRKEKEVESVEEGKAVAITLAKEMLQEALEELILRGNE